jgi:hypothetical protein
MKIRAVKPISPIKINNHWVYRVDDTLELELSDLIKYMQDNFVDPKNIDTEREVVNLLEDFLGYKLGVK